MQWEIQARSKVCCKCRREFLDGDVYRCVLTFRDDQPFRRDFCQGCWDSDSQSPLDPDGQVISWWQSSVRIPPPKPKEEAIRRSLAEELLRKYLDSPEPKYVNFRYILALMLERRRILSQKHVIREDPSGKTLIVYEHARTGETFIIQDPHLSLSRITEVQAQVKEILDSEQKPRETQEDEVEDRNAENATGKETQE